jgi:serine/threonine protein kinase
MFTPFYWAAFVLIGDPEVMGRRFMTNEPNQEPADALRSADIESRLFPLLHGYWEALRRGEQADPQQWLSRHPDNRAADVHALAVLAALNEARQAVNDESQLGMPDADIAALQVGTTPLLEPGTRLGECRIEKLLGSGGMGEVYLAEHEVLGRKVAVKVLPADRAGDPESVRRFRKSVQVLAQLDPHAHIAGALHASMYQDRLYLVMEYVPGVDLRTHVQQSGPLPVDEACALIRQAAVGLDYAHGQAIVHRDIKPANLMRTPDGTIKILDLGLARRTASAADACESEQTRPGDCLGTCDYMAPEQAENARRADPRSDLYSLGCTFYYLLTGRPPFDQGSPVHKLFAHARDIPPSPEQVRPDVPAAIAAILAKLLAKRPEDRYPSARALIEALDTATGSRPPESRFTVPKEPCATPAQVPVTLEPLTGGGDFPKLLVPANRFPSSADGSKDFGTVKASAPQTPAARFALLRPRWLAVAGVSLLLAGIGTYIAKIKWEGGNPVLPPLEPKLDVRIWKKQDTMRGLTLNDSRALPLRPGDFMRVEVEVNRPAYLYLIYLDADGKASPLFPWREYDWRNRPAEEKPQASLQLPEDPLKDGAPLKPGSSGTETMLLLARDTPLSKADNDALVGLFTAVPRQGQFDPLRGAVWLSDAGKDRLGNDQDRGRPEFDQARQLEDPVRRVRRVLRLELRSLNQAGRAVCFPFQGG